MIDCLTNLLLLVNLKKKNNLVYLKVQISRNLEPGTYLQYQIGNAHLIWTTKEYLKHIDLTNVKAMLAKCPLSLMTCFKSNKLRISVNELYKIS